MTFSIISAALAIVMFLLSMFTILFGFINTFLKDFSSAVVSYLLA